MKPRKVGAATRTLALRSESAAKRRASERPPPVNTAPSGRSIINGHQPPTGSSYHRHQISPAPPATYTCAGCTKPITKRDRFLLKACDKFWHENCLKCDRCGRRLGELDSSFYSKADMNLCRQDYLDLFGEKGTCTVCSKLIRPSELVMRARDNVYHLECFACQLCNQRFCVGDQFYLCDNKVVCQYDYLEHLVPLEQSLEALQGCPAAAAADDLASPMALPGDVGEQVGGHQQLEELHRELTLLGEEAVKEEGPEMVLLTGLVSRQEQPTSSIPHCSPEDLLEARQRHRPATHESLLACDTSSSSSSSP